MDTTIIGMFLPVALALVMFGLGLTLTIGDFVRVARSPKAAVIALFCQIVVLPVICLGLVLLFDLAPTLAVGMMLLAASPGGTTANLFSHLADGDVALNISLTAINSVLAVVTLPIVVGLSLAGFLGSDASIGMQPAKMLQVFAIVLVPVAIGMWVRRRLTAFAERMRRPVKIASVAVLVLAITAAAGQEFGVLLDHATSVGVVALLLSVSSLVIGYYAPRLLGVAHRQSIASAMEIGIHNAVLAITVAVSVLDSTEMAIPAAVYGVVMFFPAAGAAYLLVRTPRRGLVPVAAAG